MPEDIQQAIPYIKELLAALKIPVVSLEGYEADDLMGTLSVKAEELGFIIIFFSVNAIRSIPEDPLVLYFGNFTLESSLLNKTLTIF